MNRFTLFTLLFCAITLSGYSQEKTLTQTTCLQVSGAAGITGDQYWQKCKLTNLCDQPIWVRGAKVNTTYQYYKESKSKTKRAFKTIEAPDLLIAPNTSFEETKEKYSNDNRTYQTVIGQEGVAGTIVQSPEQTPDAPYFQLEKKERIYIGVQNNIEYYLEVKKSLENENGFFEMRFKVIAENLGTGKKVAGVDLKFSVWMDGAEYQIHYDFGKTKVKKDKSKVEKVGCQMNYIPRIYIRIDEAFGLILNSELPGGQTEE